MKKIFLIKTIHAAPGDPLPASNQGQRVIIDNSSPVVVQTEKDNSIPVTVYYGLGAVVLVIIAVIFGAALLHGNKQKK